MEFHANIVVQPSFADSHRWSVDLTGHQGSVSGKCGVHNGKWELTSAELSAIPKEIPSGSFSFEDHQNIPCLDGTTIHFLITSAAGVQDKSIYSHCLPPEFNTLLRWIWEGLYEHSAYQYRLRLENLHDSFFAWGAPIRRLPQGLRIFGGMATYWKPDLKRHFEEITEFEFWNYRSGEPEIDMSNCNGISTVLYPVFIQFFQQCPMSKWRVNSKIFRQLNEAGIPAASMKMENVSSNRPPFWGGG